MIQETIHLGKTGIPITRIGLGGCPLGGHGWGEFDCDQAVAAVRKSFDSGINFFDTADVYGFGGSEELLSKTLGNDRHEVVLATKFGVRWEESSKEITKDISPKYARKALEASLKRLRLECIPLYYVHWPDGRTRLEDTLEELERCRCEGKIKAIGLSNFSLEDLRRASQVVRIDALQVQYSLVDRQWAEPLFDFVAENEITLVAWGALSQGLLSGKYDENSVFRNNDRRSREEYVNFHGEKLQFNLKVVQALKRISSETGKTPAQLALRWLLDNPPLGSVLFGAKKPEQVEDNLGAVDWTLEKRHHEMLHNLSSECCRQTA